MRAKRLLTNTFWAILMSGGAMMAHAQQGFYDPSNTASPDGKTSAYELFRTIGCPGRQLLDRPCDVPPPVAAAPAPAPVAAAPAPAPAPTLVGVNFDFDKAVLRQEDMPNVDKDVATLKTWGDMKVEVAGHTDSRGSDAYNMRLSERRADVVRNYLISKGIAADRLSAKGYGESQPIADNATDEGRFKNRRVELVPLK